MLKKIIGILSVFLMLFSLCGCDLFTGDTAELLTPPSLSGDLAPIAVAINESAGGGYTFKYPSRGDFRSAVVQRDINSDGVFEAFALYSMNDGENVTMHINAIAFEDNSWRSVSKQKIVAGGVDRIDFCDLDADGIEEILVGWEIYGTSEMQLAVYRMGEDTLEQLILHKYTHFLTSDLNQNDKKEIFIVETASAEQSNSALVLELGEQGKFEVSSCRLDSSSKTFNEPILATLSTGKPAVYIDEIKGAGAITEVLFMDKGILVNPLISADTVETVATLRSVSFRTLDINGDSVLEIPVQENVPSVTQSDVNEKLYLTKWCSFNGESLTNQLTTMINVDDRFYYTVPNRWVGKIAVLKDTNSRIREIYLYNPDDMLVGESLIYFRAVSKSEWEKGEYDSEGCEEIMNDGQTAYICRISSAARKDGITLENVKSNFKLFEQE